MQLRRALVLVVLFALGCLGWTAPLAAQESASPVSGPLPGIWLLHGFGSSGQAWRAFVEIKPDTSGRFMWKSDKGETGKEFFRRIDFDPATRQVRIQGAESTGQVSAALYTATLSDDGRMLTDGRWTGAPDSPGKWMAVYIINRPLQADLYPSFDRGN